RRRSMQIGNADTAEAVLRLQRRALGKRDVVFHAVANVAASPSVKVWIHGFHGKRAGTVPDRNLNPVAYVLRLSCSIRRALDHGVDRRLRLGLSAYPDAAQRILNAKQ